MILLLLDAIREISLPSTRSMPLGTWQEDVPTSAIFLGKRVHNGNLTEGAGCPRWLQSRGEVGRDWEGAIDPDVNGGGRLGQGVQDDAGGEGGRVGAERCRDDGGPCTESRRGRC